MTTEILALTRVAGEEKARQYLAMTTPTWVITPDGCRSNTTSATLSAFGGR
jgi:hypothetical protein